VSAPGAPTGQFIDINGARLWTESTGNGTPVVLVHAGVADSRMWDSQWDALTAVAHTVRYDLRGYGRSAVPPGPYAHREDLRGLLDALAIERAVVVGASMGCEVALAFALAYPDRVTGLVLLNTLAGIDAPSDSLRARWRAVETALDRGDPEGALEIELQMWVDGPNRKPSEVDPAVRALVGTMNRPLLQRATEPVDATEIEPDPPVTQRLGEIACPTLLITGELDLKDALESAARLVAEIPIAREERIPNAAHLPSLEASQEVTDLIVAFVTESDR
jgi:3-oxoadipate enol-lactonase